MSMVMTPERYRLLRLMEFNVIAAPTLSMQEIKVVKDLVAMGYAKDYSEFWGRRTPVRLRIWGITSGGKAVLEQEKLVKENK